MRKRRRKPKSKSNGVRPLFHDGTLIKDTTGLLEGNYEDRHLAIFHSVADVRKKQAALTKVVNAWVKLMDK